MVHATIDAVQDRLVKMVRVLEVVLRAKITVLVPAMRIVPQDIFVWTPILSEQTSAVSKIARPTRRVPAVTNVTRLMRVPRDMALGGVTKLAPLIPPVTLREVTCGAISSAAHVSARPTALQI